MGTLKPTSPESGDRTPLRIVYGVSGEGSGHASRARVSLEHLRSKGHEVRVVSYDRGLKNLSGDFDVFPVEGLTIASVENRVSLVRTFTENLRRLEPGMESLRAMQAELFDAFQPDVVLTDFEPMTAYTARRRGVPLLSIDNQHRMRYMDLPRPVDRLKEALLTETVIRAMVPSPDAAIVATFFFGGVKNERTFPVPPILRREVLELEPEDGDHVLVYMTRAMEGLVAELKTLVTHRFRVYGFGREGTEGHIEYRPFSTVGFLADLRTARAVVATAGFTLMTEALHLGKPIYALPMKGQFEQELNAHLLGLEGYGVDGRARGVAGVGDFLHDLAPYRERLAGYRHPGGNGELTARLDGLLANGARELRALRARRRGRS